MRDIFYRKTVYSFLFVTLIFSTLFFISPLPVFAETYTVQQNDSLYKIGLKYGLDSYTLQAANNLATTMIYPGQQIYIPTVENNLASRGSEFSRDDIILLARVVHGEARGESYQGQVAVAAVVLNRIDSPLFPNTVSGVIYEHLAFTAVADGQIWLEPNQTAYNAVKDALNGWDPTGGALYYWNPITSTSKWIWSRQITGQIGKHVFGI